MALPYLSRSSFSPNGLYAALLSITSKLFVMVSTESSYTSGEVERGKEKFGSEKKDLSILPWRTIGTSKSIKM